MKTMGMIFLATVIAIGCATFAQGKETFDNPCERGPVPHWAVINESREEFVDFIQKVRPDISHDVASYIAYQVCADMSIVGNSVELTKRLNLLLSKF